MTAQTTETTQGTARAVIQPDGVRARLAAEIRIAKELLGLAAKHARRAARVWEADQGGSNAETVAAEELERQQAAVLGRLVQRYAWAYGVPEAARALGTRPAGVAEAITAANASREWVTLPEAAAFVGLTRKRLFQLVQDGGGGAHGIIAEQTRPDDPDREGARGSWLILRSSLDEAFRATRGRRPGAGAGAGTAPAVTDEEQVACAEEADETGALARKRGQPYRWAGYREPTADERALVDEILDEVLGPVRDQADAVDACSRRGCRPETLRWHKKGAGSGHPAPHGRTA